MIDFHSKPSDKLIRDYYAALAQYGQVHVEHETAVRSAFQSVLRGYSKKLDWTLVPEFAIQKGHAHRIVVDAALLDIWTQKRGFWEAKDEHDDLEREIKLKLDKGYPRNNIIFQSPERAILYQNGVRQGLNEDITSPKNLSELLTQFFTYREPIHEEWDAAVAEFKERIPELAGRVQTLIEGEKKGNRAFRDSFESFYSLCRQAIDPNLSEARVETMLIQHLLTERIFRRVFHAEEFRSRNVIACEIEKVIQSLTSRHFSRDQFLSDLDRFYKAIERAADEHEEYSDKQRFLNTVYERFFQGFSPKEADTHGIVYTPQPIVDFMVRSVEDILKKEFGKSLADKGVHILDPFVGTGNFITRVMRQIGETRKSALPHKYEHELHCNEIMLLPYYIASMNIEHEYMEQTGQYKPFDGICLVDTFELAEPEQASLAFMTEENTARVKKQKEAPIFVVIGNPPYNMGQVNENDNNKNRKYKYLDLRVSETYSRASSASNKNALSDVYVKAFRWASERISEDGVVALISNNGFLDGVSFDGMRQCLSREFSSIYHLNLRGNARTTGERRKQEAGNIFDDQIRVGVGITLLVKKSGSTGPARLFVHSVADFLESDEKREILKRFGSTANVHWDEYICDSKNRWRRAIDSNDFDSLIPLHRGDEQFGVFELVSNGVKSNRDAWAYNFSRDSLAVNMEKTIGFYNSEMDRWSRSCRDKKQIDSFVSYDEKSISWSRDLKLDLVRGRGGRLALENIRQAMYRPYTSMNLYFDRLFNEEVYKIPLVFPDVASEKENACIIATIDSQIDFSAQLVNRIPCIHLGGCPSQCFPFYIYDEDGTNRRENITDWALEEFRKHYGDESITKWDIFHYVYAVLHSPEYRERYAANLKRELPRIPFVSGETPRLAPEQHGREPGAPAIPFESAGEHRCISENPHPVSPKTGETRVEHPCEPGAPVVSGGTQGPSSSRAVPSRCARDDKEVFWQFVEAGRRLAELHVHYERQPEYPLERVENPKEKLSFRVEKMRLSKDKASLVYNPFLTLTGIPPETCEYRLGNRSALEWVVDQYQVSTDKRSGIVNDPNREDDPEYILRLIGQVVHVSLETVKIVKALPGLGSCEL